MEQRSEVDVATHARWRMSLTVAVVLMAATAVMSTALTLGYDGSPVVPVCLWVGVFWIVLARRSVPKGVRAEDVPDMRRSGVYVVWALVCFLLLPVLLTNLGLVPGS